MATTNVGGAVVLLVLMIATGLATHYSRRYFRDHRDSPNYGRVAALGLVVALLGTTFIVGAAVVLG